MNGQNNNKKTKGQLEADIAKLRADIKKFQEESA